MHLNSICASCLFKAGFSVATVIKKHRAKLFVNLKFVFQLIFFLQLFSGLAWDAMETFCYTGSAVGRPSLGTTGILYKRNNKGK